MGVNLKKNVNGDFLMDLGFGQILKGIFTTDFGILTSFCGILESSDFRKSTFSTNSRLTYDMARIYDMMTHDVMM
jgi:hypothetical protein